MLVVCSGVDILGLEIVPPIGMSSLQGLTVEVVQDPQVDSSHIDDPVVQGLFIVAQIIDLLLYGLI